MISTSFLKTQLEEVMTHITVPVEKVLREAKVSRSTYYESILNEATEKTSAAVAVRIAKAIGWGYKREGDKFYFIRPESDENLEYRNRQIIEMIKNLKPDAQDKVIWLIEQLAQKDK